jgi:hypothetical protein
LFGYACAPEEAEVGVVFIKKPLIYLALLGGLVGAVAGLVVCRTGLPCSPGSNVWLNGLEVGMASGVFVCLANQISKWLVENLFPDKPNRPEF